MKWTKIAINFADNDFFRCFYGVLEILENANHNEDDEDDFDGVTNDKEELCMIINELSYGAYLLYQSKFQYSKEKDEIEKSEIKKYLQIKPEQIFLNGEVNDLLNKLGRSTHSKVFILDMDDRENYFMYSV